MFALHLFPSSGQDSVFVSPLFTSGHDFTRQGSLLPPFAVHLIFASLDYKLDP